MPPPLSAGVLLFRQRDGLTEVLLIKPGGPFWRNKDAGAWMIPKGAVEKGEVPAEAALREFEEETGTKPGEGDLTDLGTVRQKSGKVVQAYALEGDLDADAITSNTFEIEWPPRSGRRARFPEVDKAAYFDAATALWKLHKGQRPILLEAVVRLKS